MSHESAEKRTVQLSWFNMVSISIMKHPEVISLSVLLLDLNENTRSLTRTNANKTCDHSLAFFHSCWLIFLLGRISVASKLHASFLPLLSS